MIEGLSRCQIENLIEFIELHFIDSIRNDPDIDNIEYVVNMMNALTMLRDKLQIMKLAGCKHEDIMLYKKEE